MNSTNIIGKIIRKFPCREFESGERKGKVCSFQLGDETAIVRSSAWNDNAGIMDTFNEGDTVEITNAYTKEGRFGVELHLGYTASISASNEQVAPIQQIMKENATEKKMNQLTEGENAIINGKIVKILSGNLAYLVCEKCGKKATKTDNGTICDNCGEVKGKNNAVVSATIEDDTAQIQLTMFGKTALAFMKKNEEELNKELEEKSTEQIISEMNEKLNGNEIKIYGYVRANKFSGANEFVAREIIN
jgi:ssDNA-binding replication factor A large subunit